MWIGSVWRGIYRFFAAWNRLNKAHPFVSAFSAFVVLPCVLLGGTILYIALSEAYDEFKFNHLSPLLNICGWLKTLVVQHNTEVSVLTSLQQLRT